jgi:hypothetical protein
MGIHTRYVDDYDLSILRYQATIDRETLRESTALLSQKGQWPVAGRWFVDMTPVERIDLHFPDMQRYTEENSPVHLGNRKLIRVAVLYGSDLALGMLRMYETLMSEEKMEIAAFRSLEECAAFLDVPEEILQQE